MNSNLLYVAAITRRQEEFDSLDIHTDVTNELEHPVARGMPGSNTCRAAVTGTCPGSRASIYPGPQFSSDISNH